LIRTPPIAAVSQRHAEKAEKFVAARWQHVSAEDQAAVLAEEIDTRFLGHVDVGELPAIGFTCTEGCTAGSGDTAMTVTGARSHTASAEIPAVACSAAHAVGAIISCSGTISFLDTEETARIRGKGTAVAACRIDG
jgi:hypothetical protein